MVYRYVLYMLQTWTDDFLPYTFLLFTWRNRPHERKEITQNGKVLSIKQLRSHFGRRLEQTMFKWSRRKNQGIKPDNGDVTLQGQIWNYGQIAGVWKSYWMHIHSMHLNIMFVSFATVVWRPFCQLWLVIWSTPWAEWHCQCLRSSNLATNSVVHDRFNSRLTYLQY